MIKMGAALVVLLGAVFFTNAAAAEGGVKVGYLDCNVAEGFGYVFGSSLKLSCAYHPSGGGPSQKYTGKISKLGVDVGYHKAAAILWGVFSAGKLAPGSLAGVYAGATAEAAWGVGLGANVLFGGSKSSVALQPVSVSGQEGLNAAAGIAAVELRAVK